MSEKVLTVIQETEILGKKIKMYGSVECPLFMAKDVAEWIDYSKGTNGKYQITNMVKKIDDSEKGLKSFMSLGGVQETWFLSEDGLYECCMRSTKPIAKQMKSEIKKYLKSIRLTGAAIPTGDEQKMVDYYFSSFSDDLKLKMFNELSQKNKELQQFYDDLLNTDGLYSMNTTAKELNIGRNTLFAYLRGKKIMFYNDNVNIPYARFMNEEKFRVIESPCADGKYRPTTYVTRKGLDYIRKILRKDGFYASEVAE